MPRTKKNRIIQRAPNFSGFKPFGVQNSSTSEVMLHYEEYEAIKLYDYDKLNQEEASKMMHVSRPTFTRIYQSAKQKLAKALVEVAVISFEGGKAIIGIAWYTCTDCDIAFSINNDNGTKCPLCGSNDVTENK